MGRKALSTLPLEKSTQQSTMGTEAFTNRQKHNKMRSCSRIRCNHSFITTCLFVAIIIVIFAGTTTEAFATAAAASKRTTSSSSSGFGVSSKLSEQKSGTIVVAPILLPDTNSEKKQNDDLPVLTQDLVDLADLRYNEWVANQENILAANNPLELSPQSQPSRHAFRMATAEIAQERQEAVSFLARYQDNHNNKPPIAVGAAELSPIEFEGATTPPTNGTNNRIRWYVTDVVTSSNHRRMGVANLLMDALERYAHELEQTAANEENDATTATTSTILYLHVKPENTAALQFYQNPKRAYAEPTLDELDGVNLEKLASNAGITDDQILLCKTLTKDNVPPAPLEDSNDNNRGSAPVAAGFGGNTSTTKKKPKKKVKRKRK